MHAAFKALMDAWWRYGRATELCKARTGVWWVLPRENAPSKILTVACGPSSWCNGSHAKGTRLCDGGYASFDLNTVFLAGCACAGSSGIFEGSEACFFFLALVPILGFSVFRNMSLTVTFALAMST